MLTVAGALAFAVMSHGPLVNRQVDVEELPSEHREAIEATVHDDIQTAIDFFVNLTMAVKDGHYDEQWPPVVRALVDGDNQTVALVQDE